MTDFAHESLAEEMRRALCGAVGLVLGVADARPHTSVATRRDGPRAILRGRTLDGYFVESSQTMRALELGVPMPRPEDIRGGWMNDDPTNDPTNEPMNEPSATDDEHLRAFMHAFTHAYTPEMDTSRRASATVRLGNVTTTWNVTATWEGKFWEADDPAALATVQPTITLTVWSGHTLVMSITYALDPSFREVHAAYAKAAATKAKANAAPLKAKAPKRLHRRHHPPTLLSKRAKRIKTRATENERYFGPREALEYETLRRAFDALQPTVELIV